MKKQETKKPDNFMQDNAYFFDYNNQNDDLSDFTIDSPNMAPSPETPSVSEAVISSHYSLSEGHDDNVIVADLANMENEVGLENLAEDDTAPVLSKELKAEMKKLL